MALSMHCSRRRGWAGCHGVVLPQPRIVWWQTSGFTATDTLVSWANALKAAPRRAASARGLVLTAHLQSVMVFPQTERRPPCLEFCQTRPVLCMGKTVWANAI